MSSEEIQILRKIVVEKMMNISTTPEMYEKLRAILLKLK